jgi:hypothetical protein
MKQVFTHWYLWVMCLLTANGLFAQNVGVGTTTPAAKLHIKGSQDISQLLIDANATQTNANAPLIKLRASDGTDLMWIHSDHPNNTFIGLNAGKSNNAPGGGTSNTFIGSGAGNTNVGGNQNTATGYNALFSNTTGTANTAMGVSALTLNTTGILNTAIGNLSMPANTVGNNNSATGNSALYNNTKGSDNTANGGSSLYLNTTASKNVAIGDYALYNQSYSNANSPYDADNVAVGSHALLQNQPTSTTNGIKNTGVGNNALFTNTTGSKNTAFGFNADVTSNNLTNATAIGYNAKVGASNSLVLGGTGGDAVKVGIGTTVPVARLHVADSSVVFTATGAVSAPQGGLPVSGAGRRMMWYAPRAAFRVGYVDGTQWDKNYIGNYSFACGFNSSASGSYTMASGYGTSALGHYSTAMGKDSHANADYATAIGQGNIASGSTSVAIGTSNTASGISSTAMGFMTTAYGHYSTAFGANTLAGYEYATAFGQNTVASGSASTAMGYYTTATGNYSTAMGRKSEANGADATAMGYYTTANGNISMACGDVTTASGFASFAIGSHTTASGDYSTTLGSYVSTNNHIGALAIGDHSSAGVIMNSASDNTFRARFANGYRFYTTSDLTTNALLAGGDNAWSTASDERIKENFEDIDGESILHKIAGFHLTSWNYKTQDPRIFRHYGPMAQDFHAAFGRDSYGTIGNDTTINQSDFIGVNFMAVQALEKRTQTLSKQNEELITENAELKDKVNALLKRMDTFEASEPQYGFLAQDMEKVFPDLVRNIEQPIDQTLKEKASIQLKGINYTELIPVTIAAIQEQQQTIDELKSQVAALTSQLEALIPKK